MNQIFDDFERSEFSDEIFAIFGRALSVATRFDSSCKALARLPSYTVAMVTKYELSDDEYNEMINKINKQYNNLNRAIESLGFKGELKQVLSNARVARNELVHEATLGTEIGFDHLADTDLSSQLKYIKKLVHQVIKGDAFISTVISIQNKESISNYPFSEQYEDKYLNWVMERFEG